MRPFYGNSRSMAVERAVERGPQRGILLEQAGHRRRVAATDCRQKIAAHLPHPGIWNAPMRVEYSAASFFR